MKTAKLLVSALFLFVAGNGLAAREKLIADEHILASSPDAQSVYLYTPAIVEGRDGRFVVAVDYGGPGTGQYLDGPLSDFGDYKSGNQIRVYLSDNRGRTWTDSGARIPMMHEILFSAGGKLYLIGHSGRLLVTCSEDNGRTWSEPSVLCPEPRWHQSCGAVDVHGGKVTLVYEKWLSDGHPWPGVGPVLMQADENADLTDPSSWKFSEVFNPDPIFQAGKESGIPALKTDFEKGHDAPGILEASVVRPCSRSPFHDPSDSTYVIMMRANTGFKDIGVMLKGEVRPDGSLGIDRLKFRGEDIFYAYIPGAALKFHLAYDPESGLYWMVHSQITGRMNERRRLALSYSPDLLRWAEAGVVAVGPSDNGARHYATLMISGKDIYIVSRSGDVNARTAHDGNLVTFHRVKDFRKLAIPSDGGFFQGGARTVRS